MAAKEVTKSKPDDGSNQCSHYGFETHNSIHLFAHKIRYREKYKIE